MKYVEKQFNKAFDFINSIVGPGRFPSGVFGIADRDGIIAVRAYGCWPDGTSVVQDDVYCLYSVTKPISSLAVMRLWEQGRLHLDERICKYLPVFDTPEKREITIWHLLTHTSGLQQAGLMDFLGERIGASIDVYGQFEACGLDFPLGSHKTYNPLMAFSVLGEIVSIVSGLPFHVYMEREVFAPLGMRSTSFDAHKTACGRLLPTLTDNGYARMDSFLDARLPGGGLCSTAHDLLKLGSALLNGGEGNGYRLLSPNTLREMTRVQTEGIPYWNPGENIRGTEMGLGWLLPVNRRSLIIRDIFGHNGAGDCMFWVYPRQEAAFVFLTNYDFEKDPAGADIDYIHNVFASCLD